MRVKPTPAIGLLSIHEALTTGTHGVTGTLCGTSDEQTLTNKTIGAGGLTFTNEGAGDDPVLTSNSADQILQQTGHFLTTGFLMSNSNLKILSGTAFYGTFDHANSANRTYTFPDVAGTVCMWNAANAATTRLWTISWLEAIGYQDPSAGAFWVLDGANAWLDASSTTESLNIPVHLPDGAVVTALRVTSQENQTCNVETRLFQVNPSNGTVSIMAEVNSTATMEEVSDTSIDNATIDNDSYSYYVQVHLDSYTSGEGRFRNIQIDYTVTTPLP